eukprot:1960391-Alexandrium_andersonii.AAC.1
MCLGAPGPPRGGARITLQHLANSLANTGTAAPGVGRPGRLSGVGPFSVQQIPSRLHAVGWAGL